MVKPISKKSLAEFVEQLKAEARKNEIKTAEKGETKISNKIRDIAAEMKRLEEKAKKKRKLHKGTGFSPHR